MNTYTYPTMTPQLYFAPRTPAPFESWQGVPHYSMSSLGYAGYPTLPSAPLYYGSPRRSFQPITLVPTIRERDPLAFESMYPMSPAWNGMMPFQVMPMGYQSPNPYLSGHLTAFNSLGYGVPTTVGFQGQWPSVGIPGLFGNIPQPEVH